MKDLAARLGVSQTTVSHVLSGRHAEFRISAATAERVRRAAEQLGYRASALARSLRDRRSYAVGLVVEDLTNPFWTAVAMGAENQAVQRGYLLVVSNTAGDPERERRALALVRDRRVDGLLLPPSARSLPDLRVLEREGHPFVQIDRALAGLRAPCVRTDHEGGARLVARHLAGRGHRRVALLVGPASVQPYKLRQDGFRDECARQQIGRVDVLRVPDPTPEEARRVLAAYLRKRGGATALFAANIWLTVGALRAIHAAGLDVPRDLDLAGFDDMAFADLLRHPVTTVVQDEHAIGARAFDLLLQLQGGERPPGEVLVPPRLAVR